MGNLSEAEIKNDLHRLIVETDDLIFLEEIRMALSNHRQGGTSVDWWDVLGERGKASIKKGLEQVEKGERIPHRDVRKEIDQLFEKAKASQKP